MRISFIVKLVIIMLMMVALVAVFVRVRDFDKQQACTQNITNTVYVCK